MASHSPDLDLEQLWGVGLIQAVGKVKGRGFYFRARHPTWAFEMENDAGQLPTDVSGNPILYIQGWYSNTNNMTHDEARRIISRCSAMFVELISFQKA